MIGNEIYHNLENIAVNKAAIKCSKQVNSLPSLHLSVNINGETAHVDPTILFQRLVMFIERLEDMASYF